MMPARRADTSTLAVEPMCWCLLHCQQATQFESLAMRIKLVLGSPGFYDARSRPHSPGSTSELVQLSDDLIDLHTRCQSLRKHCVCDVLHGECIDQLHLALGTSRLSDTYLHILEAILGQQPWQAWPDVCITSSAPHRLSVKLDVAPERTAVWIAEVAAKVGIRNDQDSSWAERPPDLSERLNWVRHV